MAPGSGRAELCILGGANHMAFCEPVDPTCSAVDSDRPLGADGAAAVGAMLAANRSLRSLDVCDNEIGGGYGKGGLARGGVKETLTLTPQGGRALAAGVEGNGVLEEVRAGGKIGRAHV